MQNGRGGGTGQPPQTPIPNISATYTNNLSKHKKFNFKRS
jgi:hypothetical protein